MKYTYFTTTLLVLCSLVSGCAITQNQGKLVRSGEVDQLVESVTILPDHTYFFTGPEAEPDAIIAINNRFTLKSKYWIRVDEVAEKLKDWNRYIENSTRYRHSYEGAWIMTLDGQKAGIWYSKFNHTVIQFPDPSTLILYAPFVTFEKRQNLYDHFGGPGF